MGKPFYIPLTQISLKEDFNPRSEENEGLEQEKMNAIRDAIRDRGLEASLIIAEEGKIKNVIQYKIVAGERRYRSICKLVADNTVCYDQVEERMRPASEIYVDRGVECKIKTFKNDVERKIVAIQENVLHEPLSDFEMLTQLKWLSENGVTQQNEQARIISRCEAWVSQSHSLLEPGKEKILDSIRKRKLTRTAAINFINVDDNEIDKVLEEAFKNAVALNGIKVEKAETEQKQAAQKIGTAKAIINISDCMGSPDNTAVRSARKNITKGKAAFVKAEKDIVKAQQEEIIITDNIVVKANKLVGNKDKIRKPRPVAEIRIKFNKMVEDECDPNLTDEQYQGAIAFAKWCLDCSTSDDLSNLLEESYEDEK